MTASETAPAASLAEAAESLRRLIDGVAAEASPALEPIVDACARALEAGHKLLFAGNGGSAAQCQHLAAELACRFARDRAAYAALSLTTDTSFLTACANDYAFEQVFARQVEALGRPGDVLILLSTSGRSANVLRAAEAARGRGIAVCAFIGGDGGPLAAACDRTIVVPHDDPARVQEVHLLLGHVLCGAIEARLEDSK